MQERIKKILIIFPGSLGDFIASLPALKLLRQEYPQANIDIACSRTYAPLVEGKPFNVNVRESLSYALSGLFASPFACTGRTRDYLEMSDLIISYIDDNKKIFSENLRKNSTGNVIVWKGNIRDKLEINIYSHYLKSLELIDINIQSPEYRLEIPADKKDKGIDGKDRFSSKNNYFCIHPGSGSLKKNWNIKKYIELADLIENKYSFFPVFFTGEADEKIKAEIPGKYTLLHNENLLKVALVINKGKFYIGNDSGVSHLAGSLGVKSFIIFGPTEPGIWAPPVANVSVIDKGRGNCSKRKNEKMCKTCKSIDCLNELSAEKVFEMIQNKV